MWDILLIMNSGIYKITNTTNGKSYIGSSKNLNKRMAQHKNNIKPLDNTKFKLLYFAIEEHGINKFSFEIIKQCKEEDLAKFENYYINKFDTYKQGYNTLLDGEEETVASITNKYNIFPKIHLFDEQIYFDIKEVTNSINKLKKENQQIIENINYANTEKYNTEKIKKLIEKNKFENSKHKKELDKIYENFEQEKLNIITDNKEQILDLEFKKTTGIQKNNQNEKTKSKVVKCLENKYKYNDLSTSFSVDSIKTFTITAKTKNNNKLISTEVNEHHFDKFELKLNWINFKHLGHKNQKLHYSDINEINIILIDNMLLLDINNNLLSIDKNTVNASSPNNDYIYTDGLSIITTVSNGINFLKILKERIKI